MESSYEIFMEQMQQKAQFDVTDLNTAAEWKPSRYYSLPLEFSYIH